ncbi:MAG: diaminopimelate epimerase [Terrimonas sp.]|nr:diaminopimelate epimerase [Terrimonas sp.]
MKIDFFKYQGTGNDFIILDNRDHHYNQLRSEQINHLCHRRFGIGADGLMLFNSKEGLDFEMVYFNADGKEGSMCGNGGRCIVKFAYHAGIHKSLYHFQAIDGIHEAEIDSDGTVSLKMQDVASIEKHFGDYILNTGSPHYVKIVPKADDVDVVKRGRDIRYSKEYEKEGINVNFVEQLTEPDKIRVRTYERGVENETYSCGTGVTASALVCYHNDTGFNDVEVETPGGKLSVEFDRIGENQFENIWLCGPAEKVFAGSLEI